MERYALVQRPVGEQVVDARRVRTLEEVVCRDDPELTLQPLQVLGQCIYEVERDRVLHDGIALGAQALGVHFYRPCVERLGVEIGICHRSSPCWSSRAKLRELDRHPLAPLSWACGPEVSL